MGFTTFTGTLVKEEGKIFLLVLIDRKDLRDSHRVRDSLERFSRAYNGIPVVLCAVHPETGKPGYVSLPRYKKLIDWIQTKIDLSTLSLREHQVFLDDAV